MIQKNNDENRILKIISILKLEYTTTKPALIYSNVFELLIAVILSAQCTDARVNIVTEKLFKKYTSVYDFANSDINELMQDIRSTGFYRNKAKNIKDSSKLIIEKFNGIVPKTMNELLLLKGVARKTANIVLYHGYGVIDGIAVDTHVKRLSALLGFTKSDNPIIIEQELMKIIPKSDWGRINDLLVYHGRKICIARKPKCDECKICKLCPSCKAL